MKDGVKIKAGKKTYIIENENMAELLDFLSKKQAERDEKLKDEFDEVKRILTTINPDLNEPKITHEINYILSNAGYNHRDISKYLKIAISTSHENVRRIDNALWCENRLSMPDKVMKKRLDEMSKYLKSVNNQ